MLPVKSRSSGGKLQSCYIHNPTAAVNKNKCLVSWNFIARSVTPPPERRKTARSRREGSLLCGGVCAWRKQRLPRHIVYFSLLSPAAARKWWLIGDEADPCGGRRRIHLIDKRANPQCASRTKIAASTVPFMFGPVISSFSL